MQLSRLEIKGFKSFGDKVTVHFDKGVTAVVGPNGCGKSNVVDAIRWVLGEQSTKNLRSEKMENIIFNGTKNRKAANLAEVSLTFENTKNILPTEFSEVTITRKLYRSGESEYRLNDVQCRLKDITDLFLDTGIGSDSYSIIELKMIEEIIANKENSRRGLFEEASGISKYKLRKKQTFNKLRDTENDLTRVDDLLFEIEKNLKSLENQAKKAEKYFQLKEDYKKNSIAFASFKIKNFQTVLQEIETKENNLSIDKTSVATKLSQLEAELQERKLLSLQQEKNISIQQKATQEYIAKIRSYESAKNVKNEQLKFLQETEKRLDEEVNKEQQQLNHILYNLKRLNEELLEESNKLNTQSTKLADAEKELTEYRLQQNSFKNELDQLNKLCQDKQNLLYKYEKDIEILNIQQETLVQESKRNAEDSSSKETEMSEFDNSISIIEQALSVQIQEKDKLDQFENTLKNEILSTEDFIAEQTTLLNNKNRSVDAKQNEYALTKSMVDSLEGFPESIRFLKKTSGWTKNALLFSDILFCKEDYRVAIEHYLEPYMSHYIVENYGEAVSAIKILNDASQGRANFFIKEYFDNTPIVQLPKLPNLTSALDVIDVDAKYQRLCEHLLRHVYIVEKNEDQELPNTVPAEAVVLSKSGKYFKSESVFSGGSIGLFDGKRIGRVKNLEILSKEIDTLAREIASMNATLQESKLKLESLRLSTKGSELNECNQKIQKLENELISLKTKREQYYQFLENSKNRKQDIENKLTSINASLLELQPLLSTNKDEHAKLLEELTLSQQRYSEISDLVLNKSSFYNEENIKLHQQQNKTKGLEKDIEYRESQQEALNQSISKKTQELEKAKEDISSTIHHVDFNDDELIQMYEQKENMEKALAELEDTHNELKVNISQQEEEISNHRKLKENTETLFAELKDEKNNLKLELNGLKERLSVEFGFDIQELFDTNLDEITEHLNEAEIQRLVEKAKKQLDEFGSVNPMAIEAYKEINERYEFIKSQKEDLISAKNSLLSTISEIDATAKEQFMQAFTQVRENFIKVFRTLFNEEDSCDLILSDPNNPLDADIDIIARPKGKRPLSINQLSGGEKTLTATAILFSLYLLKPAPFCIFDEVDAPLDDTNIDKFNNIIRDFSEDSQFIIVSHNKRTIASTDIIYGVTMVEQGVSRVVSVDLRNVETAA